jgi:hypothetical protein
MSSERGLLAENLNHQSSKGPNVDFLVVHFFTQKNFNRTVPKTADFLSESRLLTSVHELYEPEVAYFDCDVGTGVA